MGATKSKKNCTFMGFFWQLHITFQLKNQRRVVSNEVWSKLCRKNEFSFEKWHEESCKFKCTEVSQSSISRHNFFDVSFFTPCRITLVGTAWLKGKMSNVQNFSGVRPSSKFCSREIRKPEGIQRNPPGKIWKSREVNWWKYCFELKTYIPDFP